VLADRSSQHPMRRPTMGGRTGAGASGPVTIAGYCGRWESAHGRGEAHAVVGRFVHPLVHQSRSVTIAGQGRRV
jgi:hypothetical protein